MAKIILVISAIEYLVTSLSIGMFRPDDKLTAARRPILSIRDYQLAKDDLKNRAEEANNRPHFWSSLDFFKVLSFSRRHFRAID